MAATADALGQHLGKLDGLDEIASLLDFTGDGETQADPPADGDRAREPDIDKAAPRACDLACVLVNATGSDTVTRNMHAVAKRNPSLVVATVPANTPEALCWNVGLDMVAESLGDPAFIKPLLANDHVTPQFFASSLAALSQDPQVVVARTGVMVESGDQRKATHYFPGDRVLTGPAALFAGITSGNLGGGLSPQIWRRHAIEQPRPLRFDAQLGARTDFDFLMRLCDRGDFAYQDQPETIIDLAAAPDLVLGATLADLRFDLEARLRAVEQGPAWWNQSHRMLALASMMKLLKADGAMAIAHGSDKGEISGADIDMCFDAAIARLFKTPCPAPRRPDTVAHSLEPPERG